MFKGPKILDNSRYGHIERDLSFKLKYSSEKRLNQSDTVVPTFEGIDFSRCSHWTVFFSQYPIKTGVTYLSINHYKLTQEINALILPFKMVILSYV